MQTEAETDYVQTNPINILIHTAAQAARDDEARLCAADICEHCRAGEPMADFQDRGWFWHHVGPHKYVYGCAASATRKRRPEAFEVKS